jgi:hypothetical protein
MTTWVAGAGLALTASAAFGQPGTNFTISDGNVFFTSQLSPTVPTAGSVGADFRVTGAAGTDHLFGNWWWYRLDGTNTRENAFNTQVGPTVVAGNTATRNYAFPEFNVSLTYTVNSTGATSGTLTETLVINPLMQGSLNIFNYADFFVNGADAGDRADVANTSTMTIRDVPSGTILNFDANPSALNFQVGPFNSILPLLTNAVVNDLNNTNGSVPAGADIEGVFQWRVAVVPGQAITISERFTIPAPGALALLGLGGLVAARRRR